MDKEINNPIFQVIDGTFEKSTKTDLEKYYLKLTNGVKKWTCYSDYCFGDSNKPNDVVCFTLIPYVVDFEELCDNIQALANVDIKKTRKVRDEFVEFLKSFPLINFSFILNDKKKIFGKDHDAVKKSLKATYTEIKKKYSEWSKNQPEQREDYKQIIKKLNCIIQLIDSNKKIKQIIDMTLVTFIGAYVCSRVIKDLDLEIFGWFSDRDAINEICDNSSISLFHTYLHGFLDGKPFQFVASPAGSTDNPFYEQLVRIPDYVAGALADYDMENDLISKDKFDTMLTDYMAENVHNNFVYTLSLIEDKFSCVRIDIHKKA
jgi:hypothetical protein